MTYTDHIIPANKINLHYVEYPDNGPTVILMHGLSANALAFEGIVGAGLAANFHLVSVDLRGRGLSDHPAFCYSQEEHALDIIALIDHLKLDQVFLVGHSFGGLLSFYLAAHYPERVKKVVVLDAAARMNPRAGEMLSFRLNNIDKIYPSFDAYLQEVKEAPYNTFWDDAMMPYYKADVMPHGDGVTPRSNLTNLIEAAVGLSVIDWPFEIEKVKQEVLLINAPDDYTMDEPLLPDDYAKETVALLPRGHYLYVDGNHQTMLYGHGAVQIAKAIKKFFLPE